MNDVTLIHGDSLSILPTLAAGSVDLIATDPPYGMTALEWDRMPDLPAMWSAFWRVLKPDGVVVTTASQPFTTDLISSNRESFKYTWTWVKNGSSGFANRKIQPLRATEDVVVFARSKHTYNPQMRRVLIHDRTVRDGARNGNTHIKTEHLSGKFANRQSIIRKMVHPRNVLEFDIVPHATGTLHPTQKPVALFDYLIRTYSNEGDMVLDPYAGSGTTLEACVKTCRKGIGIELQTCLIPVIERRLRDAATPLFAEVAG